MLLTQMWFLSSEIGLIGSYWSTSTTSWPYWWVFVRGKCRRHDRGFLMEHLKSARVGRGLDSRSEAWDGKSSPRRHCPQKAVTVQAATATSNGELRSRSSVVPGSGRILGYCAGPFNYSIHLISYLRIIPNHSKPLRTFEPIVHTALHLKAHYSYRCIIL